tara:strand:- start:925 stop:1950 length:1026 start_codon:yes stop_codon:yes gene_type:complete
MRNNNFKFKKVFIIAEIGVNHNGDLEMAKDMIYAAKLAGADAVKFQTFSADKLASINTPKVKYQINKNFKDESHYQMLKKLELSFDDHIVLNSFCEKNKIMFLSTPYDVESAKFLHEKLNISFFKTASADIVDIPLHKYISSTLKPCIISTGMSTISEIEKVYQIYNKSKIAFLHCISNYPCSDQSLNLNVIKTLRRIFNVPIGFSDHSIGSEAAIASVSLGAKIIEKHFTTDKLLDGPDQKTSSNPEEFRVLVRQIRRVENMLGIPFKQLQNEEIDMLTTSRKSLHVAKDIKKNQIVLERDLELKRPGNGLSYDLIDFLIGKKASKELKKGHKICLGDVL